jgi:hypothetical protein
MTADWPGRYQIGRTTVDEPVDVRRWVDAIVTSVTPVQTCADS